MAYYDALTFAAWAYAARSGVPRGYWRLGLATHPAPAAVAAGQAWLAAPRPDPAGLLLYGPTGTGKTGLGVGLLWAAWEQGLEGQFVLVPALLDALRAQAGALDSGPDPLAPLRTVPLLVLDDLGAQRLTPFAEERIYVLINARHADARRTVVTTNLPPDALDEALSTRIAWRLRALCAPLALGQ